MTNNLPDHPADLIDLAVDDLETCERDHNYVIEMRVWHRPRTDRRCEVSLEGAVLAKSLDYPPNQSWISGTENFEEIKNKIGALESFGRGEIDLGLAVMGYKDVFVNRRIAKKFEWPPSYHYKPKEFKIWMRSLATTIRDEWEEVADRTTEDDTEDDITDLGSSDLWSIGDLWVCNTCGDCISSYDSHACSGAPTPSKSSFPQGYKSRSEKILEKKCECGSEATGLGGHSDWCPKSECKK